jgi:hypothetical protein
MVYIRDSDRLGGRLLSRGQHFVALGDGHNSVHGAVKRIRINGVNNSFVAFMSDLFGNVNWDLLAPKGSIFYETTSHGCLMVQSGSDLEGYKNDLKMNIKL